MCCSCFDSKLLELKYAYEKMIKDKESVSESDVQANLVEPILKLIGIPTYDIDVLKRTDRNSKDPKPDIIVKLKDIDILIEVKSLKSTEFNVDKVYDDKKKEVGKLENGKNKNGDGVGQIRRYWLEHKNNNKIIIPILTNGERWVIFNFDNKVDTEPIKPEDVLLDISIKDYLMKLVD